MVALDVSYVIHRVVEVNGVTTFASSHNRNVVNTALADRQREKIGALQREVRRVVGAERASRGDELLWSSAVVENPRDDLIDDPVFVQAVGACSVLKGEVRTVPAAGVEAVNAVDLHSAGVDQGRNGRNHSSVFVVPGAPFLSRKDQNRTA